jgi:hypothetical protein
MSLTGWMKRYVRAWSSNRKEDIADLFTLDAIYDPQTSETVWEGRDAIVTGWLAIADEPGTWAFEWQTLAETPQVAVVTGRTTYSGERPRTYRNLWIIDLTDDGRCREFSEWWIEEDW